MGARGGWGLRPVSVSLLISQTKLQGTVKFENVFHFSLDSFIAIV